MKLMRLVLTNTNFTFNGEHYQQIGRTSMGTGFDSSYAYIFMAWFEEEAIKNYHLKPLFWKRFIDDVFCICRPHGKDELDKFVDYLNNIHVAFLDTTVKLDHETNTIYTTLYTKPTDTHSYLHYSSSHNKSCT